MSKRKSIPKGNNKHQKRINMKNQMVLSVKIIPTQTISNPLPFKGGWPCPLWPSKEKVWAVLKRTLIFNQRDASRVEEKNFSEWMRIIFGRWDESKGNNSMLAFLQIAWCMTFLYVQVALWHFPCGTFFNQSWGRPRPRVLLSARGNEKPKWLQPSVWQMSKPSPCYKCKYTHENKYKYNWGKKVL